MIMNLSSQVYEKRPPGSDWNHRLKVTSLAVECVYNHQLLQKVMDHFFIHHTASDEERSLLGQRIRKAARSGFEAVKQKTKEELNQTWAASVSKRPSQHQSLDLLVNISAPHILIPESVVSRDSLLLVVDFGNFHVTRTDVNCIAAELASTATDDDDDEEYMTPCSTPPNEPEASSPVDDVVDACSVLSGGAGGIKEADEMVDKYNVHFSDLQLLVCRVKDNWKQAHLKGTSALHLLDRFSILIRVEKYARLVPALDKPLLSLTASLPRLVAHINEPKIHSLIAVSQQFPASFRLGGTGAPDPSQRSSSSSDHGVMEDSADGVMEHETEDDDDEEEELRMAEEHAHYWMLVQFSVDQLSVEVQSRGRSVAELQVGGFQASYSVRRAESAFHLAVHSLLLVDAMQTLGSDYELLVASHKHVW